MTTITKVWLSTNKVKFAKPVVKCCVAVFKSTANLSASFTPVNKRQVPLTKLF